jgi:DNA polymerase-3 subunit gamma/tau
MASQALYLKWRPQRFEDVVGQEHVTTTLKNALQSGRVSHAYLFSGPRGTGKTSMARLLAKAVNCLDEDVSRRPCNECHICLSVNQGRLLDLIEMDAASHTGVDNVREAIRDKVGFRPTEARFKVYVIDEVHMLSTSAFNALLKTLEEPPEHVIFCLATTEPQKVLTTILSRCQHFEFRRIGLSALVERLQYISGQEGLRVEPDALQLMARMSAGCARDAISLLDQITAYGDEMISVERVRAVLGLSDEAVIYELLNHLAAHDVGRGLDVIGQVVEHGAGLRQFAQQVIESLRAALLLRIGGASALPDVDAQAREHLGTLAERLSVHDLVRSIKLFNQAQLDLRSSDQSQLALELALVEAALSEPSEPDGVSEAHAVQAARPVKKGPAPSPPPVPVQPAGRSSVPPPAPPRSVAVPNRAQVSEDGAQERPPGGEMPVSTLSMEELDASWDSIMRSLRAKSVGIESFVGSARTRTVEDGNCIVLGFPGTRNDPGFNFSAKKLGEADNKRIVEEVASEVLGKLCRLRCVVGGDAVADKARSSRPRPEERASSVQRNVPSVEPAAAAPESDGPAPGAIDTVTHWEAASDPVVQDLVQKGGEVADVRLLSDSAEEE